MFNIGMQLVQLDDILAPAGEMLMVTVAENDPQGW